MGSRSSSEHRNGFFYSWSMPFLEVFLTDRYVLAPPTEACFLLTEAHMRKRKC
nr:hypothetical protein Q903MT_gene1005 [Picea sitchensis]